MRQKYALTVNTIMEGWVEKHNSVVLWLSKLNGSKETRAHDLFRFCEWAGKSPEELLELKSSFNNCDAERLLDLFVVKCQDPESMRWRSSIAVKSFFRCNYRQLQAESGKMEYVTKKPQRCPSKKQRLKLYRACYNPRDRAIVCVATCSAIAIETMSRLQWSFFEENWIQQAIPHISIASEFLKGHGKGRYKGVRQETFLTPQAKRELLEYREYMTKQYGILWREEDYVFLSLEEPHDPLTYGGLANTVVSIRKRAGVPFSIHDGRRIVETALENVSTPRNWIQKVKGRKVRGEDAPYSKPAIEQLRKKYREALPDLEFLREPEKQPGSTLSASALSFFEKMDKLLDDPERAEKFEKFILQL